MNILDRLTSKSPTAEEVLREGYYTRAFDDEWYATTFRKHGTLPPDQTRFCDKCGHPVRWMRAFPQFNSRDGRSGHIYVYRCSQDRDWTEPWYRQEVHYGRGSTGKYLWLARSEESIETSHIRSVDYA